MFNKKTLFSALILIIGITLVANEAIAQEQLEEVTLTGQVIDAATQQSLEGVQVMLDGEDMEATTGTDGSFSFEGLSAGTYTVMAQADGYQDWEDTVSVSEDGGTLTIEMEPKEYEK